MVSLYELLGVLLTSFVLNLIPFAGPSNLLIAANVALLVNADPWTVGLLVALGSASAKSLHYVVAFFARRFVSERRREFLDEVRRRVGRWAFVALYIAAATPIPDEPVVIPLGLLRYSPAKFYLAYFLGKLSITIPGAYAGGVLKERFEPLIGREAMTIASIVMTIVITIILLKVDVNRVVQSIKRRWRAILEGRHDHGGANAVSSRLEAACSTPCLELVESEGHFPRTMGLDVVPAFIVTLKAYVLDDIA
jgi:membrane protein YqaA with SNARE-associated domain